MPQIFRPTSLHSWFCHSGLALNFSVNPLWQKQECKDVKIWIVISLRPSYLVHLRNFLPFTGVNIAGTPVPPSDKIVTLGVTLDNSLTISNVCRSSYFHIRALCHIRQALHRRHGYDSSWFPYPHTYRLCKLSYQRFHQHQKLTCANLSCSCSLTKFFTTTGHYSSLLTTLATC